MTTIPGESDPPQVARIEVMLTQDGNTMGTTSDCEVLTICLEYQLPGELRFLVLKTEGWSCESPQELEGLLGAVCAAADKLEGYRPCAIRKGVVRDECLIEPTLNG